jgi:PleD family two-component response regulator
MVDYLVGAADKAMYRAKRSGGNRFHHHGQSD